MKLLLLFILVGCAGFSGKLKIGDKTLDISSGDEKVKELEGLLADCKGEHKVEGHSSMHPSDVDIRKLKEVEEKEPSVWKKWGF